MKRMTWNWLNSLPKQMRTNEPARARLDKPCPAFDKVRTANLSSRFRMFRKELEVFMKAVHLSSPADRVFLTRKGNHFKRIARQSPDWSRQREKLFELQEESQAHIRKLINLAAEERPEFSTHLGDAASDTYDRDLTLSLVSFEQEKLYEIEAALKRIDDGSYGICEFTGRPIPKTRLDAIPWARFSEAAERSYGATCHPHLGELHSVRILPSSILLKMISIKWSRVSFAVMSACSAVLFSVGSLA